MNSGDLFGQYPALQEVLQSIPGTRFRGVEETIGLNVTPQLAYQWGRGLLEVPTSSTEASVSFRADVFAAWIRSGLSGVDFSQGCCFWIASTRPGHRGLPWVDVELESSDMLLPLWLELQSQVVIVFSPASYCILAFYAAENGWEMFRQP
jgi:hypothetical protein